MKFIIAAILSILIASPMAMAQQSRSPESILNSLNEIYGKSYELDQANALWKKDLKLQRYLNYYFLNKPVYLTPQMIQRLIELGYFDQKPEQQNYAIGFFAVVFKQNPDLLRSWLDQLEITQYQAGALIRAARHAGLGEVAKDWLANKDWEYMVPADQDDEEVFGNLSLPIEDDVDSAEAVQRMWGGYAASGEQRYLARLFDTLLITDVPLNQVEINKGNYDSFLKRTLNELLEGLFINAGAQYNDVHSYIMAKVEEPALQNNGQLRRIVIKVNQERAKSNAEL